MKNIKVKFEKVLEVIVKFTTTRYMKIITNGFMAIAALSIAGSLFSLAKSFPFDPWLNFLATSGLGDLLSIPVAITSDLIAVFVVLAMAYNTAEAFDEKPFAPAIIAFAAFMILTPFTGMARVITAEGETITATALGVLPLSVLGARGIFLAIIVGITASRLYIALVQKGVVIKMPSSVPPAVKQMFESMIPGGIVFLVYLVIRYLVGLTSYETLQNLIYTLLQTPLTNVSAGLGGVLVYQIAGKVLWLFGVHGGLVTYAAMSPILRLTGAENVSAFAAGLPAPYIEWGLATAFTNVGIFSLTLLMLWSKSKHHKNLSKLALPTSTFNITEPIVFGLPMIMNPIMAIPFILSPIISILLTIFVMNIGLVAPITGVQVSNMLPLPIMLTFMNSSWTGFVWGLVIIVINVALYYPFYKVLENKAIKKELETTVEE